MEIVTLYSLLFGFKSKKMSAAHSWNIFGAAILGVIGAASILIIEHYRQERRRHVMNQDLDRLSRQLSVMRLELDQLRTAQQ